MNDNKITQLRAGDLTASSKDAVVGSQLFITNQDVTTNATAIMNLNSALEAGTAGLVLQDATSKRITVAKDLDGVIVDMTGSDGARTLAGVEAGTLSAASQDAVNGSQLYATNAIVSINTTAIAGLDVRVAGNTSSITALDGRVTQNTGDIADLAQSLNNDESGLVLQDATTKRITVAKDLDGDVVDLTGSDGARTLAGVEAGALSVSSQDAVNGAQLYATNENVLANTVALNTLDGLVAQNTTNLNNLTASINSGGLGMVMQDADTRKLTVGQDADGDLVDIAGTDGARQLTGVADGTIAAGSLYAVNGAQLHAMGTSFAGWLGGGASVNADGSMSAPSFSVGGVAYNSVGGAVEGLDNRVTEVQSTVDDIQDQMNNGQAGLVRQDSPDGAVTVAGHSGGNLVDMSGTDGARRITGVEDGDISSGSTDAVNGGQLYELSQQIGEAAAMGDYVKADGAGDGSDAAFVEAGAKGVATGANASVTADYGVAIGSNAAATAASSVALGAGSVADRANSVSMGSKGAERQVTNVAAGTQQTDAVNVGQLVPVVAGLGGGAGIDEATGAVTGPSYVLDGQTYGNVGDALSSLDGNVQTNREGLSRLDSRLDQTNRAVANVARNAYSGIAATTALTMVPEVDQGKNFALGMGMSTYRGYQAIALGASARVNDRVRLKAGVGVSSGGATAGVGASMQW
ncbi:YadA family autotransporter adhesin [Achromobacter sp. NPDC058515]|uniref:YadA family autotransporter adhesin n=1 Tax=Achromobacter sp. NPDC058515 TaxID=3346533 RepID=UPI00364D9158